MGIWDFTSGPFNFLKRPTKAYDVVVVKPAQTLNRYCSDEEIRSKFFRFAVIFLKNAFFELLKLIPGYNLVRRSLRDMEEEESRKRLTSQAHT